jgi:hypothetical protein
MSTATIETPERNRPTSGATTRDRRRLRRLTRAARTLYLAIFVLYPLATAVRSTIVVPGDAATTAQNVAANETLFR